MTARAFADIAGHLLDNFLRVYSLAVFFCFHFAEKRSIKLAEMSEQQIQELVRWNKKELESRNAIVGVGFSSRNVKSFWHFIPFFKLVMGWSIGHLGTGGTVKALDVDVDVEVFSILQLFMLITSIRLISKNKMSKFYSQVVIV